MGNTVFFWTKSWWKYDVYWLLKSSCFDLFRDEKYRLFWAKKLFERWYLLITEKFFFRPCWWWEIRSFFSAKKLMERWYLFGLFELSMIFQDFRNMVFHAVGTVGRCESIPMPVQRKFGRNKITALNKKKAMDKAKRLEEGIQYTVYNTHCISNYLLTNLL